MNGRRIACVRRAGAAMALVILLSAVGCSASFDFSPDGRQIVVGWPTGEEGGSLALVNTDGSGLRLLPASRGGNGASWSHDGRYIVFEGEADGRAATRLYDARSGQMKILDARIGPPYAWREDGRAFAGVTTDDDNAKQVVFYNVAEMGTALRVAVADVTVISMVWLPNTDDIAFLGERDGATNVYAVEGGQSKRISTTGDIIPSPALSADRKKLLWARKSRNPRYILMSIYAYDLARRSVTRLKFPDRVAAINPSPRQGPDSVDYVAFSPRGDRLALHATMPLKPDPKTKAARTRVAVYTLRMDGSDARLVRSGTNTQGAADDDAMLPFWSRDGSSIAVVHASAEVVLALFRADGAGGKVLARQVMK